VKLVITESIVRDEFGPLKKVFDVEILKSAAKKSLMGLGIGIKSPYKVPFSTLSKIYLTSAGSAGRAVFLIQVCNDKAVLVMLRSKSDKRIGANMAVQNPKFRKVLERNLNLIICDLELGRLSEYEI
jgi:hypothetical protein